MHWRNSKPSTQLFSTRRVRASSGDLGLTAADDAYTVRMEVTVTVGIRSVPETVGAGVLSLMKPAAVQYLL